MQDTEARIAELLDRDDLPAAATVAIEAYGGELFGFIVSRLGREQYANDAFAWLMEDLWKGLPGYARWASFRAWLYALARNACHRYLDREVRPRRREAALSEVPELMKAAERVRTETALHLRTTGRDRAQALREKLSEEEQILLTLRLDRKLDWREVAQALGAEDERIDAEAARLRKRFQLVKDKLARWAREAGWLRDSE